MMLQVRACRRDAGARQAARTAPAHLMVFDVLVTADGPLLDELYRVRRALPEALFAEGVWWPRTVCSVHDDHGPGGPRQRPGW
jgi:ATP-dependent DNA ligase